MGENDIVAALCATTKGKRNLPICSNILPGGKQDIFHRLY